jgi:hypothetical protein
MASRIRLETQLADALLKYLETVVRGYKKNPDGPMPPRHAQAVSEYRTAYDECLEGVRLAALAGDSVDAVAWASHAASHLAFAVGLLGEDGKDLLRARGRRANVEKRKSVKDLQIKEATKYLKRHRARGSNWNKSAAAQHAEEKFKDAREALGWEALRKHLPDEGDC